MTDIENTDGRVDNIPVKNEQNEEDKIIDSFLNQVDEQKKTWVDNVFEEDKNLGKDSKNLKKWFENFLKYEKEETNIFYAKNELLDCENQGDVRKFIEDHQWCKVASGVVTYEMDLKKEKTKVVEREAANNEAEAANNEAEAANNEAEAANKEAEAANKEAITTNKGAEVQATGEKIRDLNNKEISLNNDINSREQSAVNLNDIEQQRQANVNEQWKQLGMLYENLKLKHNTLEKDVQHIYEGVKSTLEKEGVLNQIKKKWGDEESINNYILIRATLQVAKNNSEYWEQEIWLIQQAVKNFENSCNIPDTSLDSFSKENIKNTREELFNKEVWNESLIKIRDDNTGNRDYSEVFHEMGDEELIQNYWKFLEWISKDFSIKYQTDPKFKELTDKAIKVKDSPDATNQDKQLWMLYSNMIRELKDKKMWVEEKTKDLIEEMCLITQVNWMAKCIWQENRKDFNKANDIKIDENGVMTLKVWDISMRQNTKEEWSRLQISSKIVKTDSSDTENLENPENKSQIEIWGEWKFKNSPFRLPGQESIFKMVTDTVQSNSSLENFDNIDAYIDDIQANIVSRMEDVYKDADQAHDYMREQAKKLELEKGVREFLENFTDGKWEFSWIIDESKKELYDFVNTMMFNIENSTETERDTFIEIIKRINEMAKLGKDKSNDSGLTNHSNKFAQYLTGEILSNTRKFLKGDMVEENKPFAFKLFENYKKENDDRKVGSELRMLDFEQMKRDLDIVEAQVAENKSPETKKDEQELAAIEDIFNYEGDGYPPEYTA